MAGIAGQLTAVDLAAHGVYMMTATLFYLGPLAIADSTATLTGNYLGNNQPDGAKSIVILGITCDFMWGLVTGSILFFLMRPFWASFFSKNADVALVVYSVMPVMYLYVIIDSMKCIVLVILRSTGRPGITVVGNTLSCLLIMLPMGWLLGIHYGYGLIGIWISMALGWFTSTLIYLIVIYRTDWTYQASLAQERNALEHTK